MLLLNHFSTIPSPYPLLLATTFLLFLTERGCEGSGTIVATPNFNPKADAKILNNAMAGIGTTDATVIKIICGRTNQERQEIAKAYQADFGRSLHTHIKTDTMGHYGELMEALMVPTAEYDAAIANNAIKVKTLPGNIVRKIK